MADLLVLISQVPEDQKFAEIVAKTSGLKYVAPKTVVEGVNLISGGNAKVIMVDASTSPLYKAFEDAIQETIGLFSDLINPNQLHYITPLPIEQTPYLTQSPLFGHILLRKFTSLEQSGEQYGRLVAATLKDRAFGLSQLMKPGTKIQTLKLAASDQKQKAVEALRSFMLTAKFQSRIASMIANAIDEILMNAIFDAPTDGAGKQLHVNTNRATAIKLEGKSEVEIQVAFDGAYLAVTAVDHFGSLNKAKLLSHVAKIYTAEQYKIKNHQAGAGIGISNVYRTGGSFFFASESGDRTEVTIFFKKTDTYREFREQFKFFSTQFYF